MFISPADGLAVELTASGTLSCPLGAFGTLWTCDVMSVGVQLLGKNLIFGGTAVQIGTTSCYCIGRTRLSYFLILFKLHLCRHQGNKQHHEQHIKGVAF